MRGCVDIMEILSSVHHADDEFFILQWTEMNTVWCRELDAMSDICHQATASMMNHTATLSIMAIMVVPFN